jgi:hypothetical protein
LMLWAHWELSSSHERDVGGEVYVNSEG